MKTLLDERFAPITSSFGFFELPLAEVAAELERWRRGLHDSVAVEHPVAAFPAVLHRLEPLSNAPVLRELLLSTRSGWTAYFTSHLDGADEAPIAHLTRTLLCNGLAVLCVPRTGRRSGAISFQMYGPLRTHFLNYVRNVSAIYGDDRWVWNLTGTEQAFEEPTAYRARRVRDRFTSDMLERYCQALDVDVFNPDFYGPEAVLVRSLRPAGPHPVERTLAEAQQYAGIVPGAVAHLRG